MKKSKQKWFGSKKKDNYFKALNLDVETFEVDADLTSIFPNSLSIKVGDPFVVSLLQSKQKVVGEKREQYFVKNSTYV